jgi:hypothetical protein
VVVVERVAMAVVVEEDTRQPDNARRLLAFRCQPLSEAVEAADPLHSNAQVIQGNHRHSAA